MDSKNFRVTSHAMIYEYRRISSSIKYYIQAVELKNNVVVPTSLDMSHIKYAWHVPGDSVSQEVWGNKGIKVRRCKGSEHLEPKIEGNWRKCWLKIKGSKTFGNPRLLSTFLVECESKEFKMHILLMTEIYSWGPCDWLDKIIPITVR